MAIPAVFDWDVHVRYFPPLHAEWDPRRRGRARSLRWCIGVLAVAYAARPGASALVACGCCSWRTSAGWPGCSRSRSSTATDGDRRRARLPVRVPDHGARRSRTCPRTLRRVHQPDPLDRGPDNWPVHIAGHPPGALTVLRRLWRIGLGGGFAAGFVVTRHRGLDDRRRAADDAGARRRAARAAGRTVPGDRPGGDLACAVSADAMFAARGRLGAVRAGAGRPVRRSVGWSVVGRAAARATCVMMSLRPAAAGVAGGRGARRRAFVAAAACRRRSRRWRSCSRSSPFGFAWWEALPGRCASATGTGSPTTGRREYWMWGDLAALVFSAGPLVWRRRRPSRSRGDRAGQPRDVVCWLVGSGHGHGAASPTSPR